MCETASLFELAECEARCIDPATQAALRVMIRDETQHAILAWRTVLWLLLNQEGEAVKREVTSAFNEAILLMAPCDIGLELRGAECENWLFEYGRLPEVLSEMLQHVVKFVCCPLLLIRCLRRVI